MAVILPVKGVLPQFGDDCFIAVNATVVGDVIMGDQCSVWFNTVIRGDVNSIRIGNKVNIQDGAVIHATYQRSKVVIGNNVSIGHNAIVHGCTLHDNLLIGMGAIVMDNAEIGSHSIIAFRHSYHGSTQGALSVMGDEYWRNAFRPLLPDVLHLDYNDAASLDCISGRTACVIAETVQAENGVKVPDKSWLQLLKKRCDDHGALLILDEIQAGFGRTGTLWAFEQYDVVPDILLLGKALGGGMPLGAFVTARERMQALTQNPVLGHITTFGGHPLCCAAGMASMQVLLREGWIGAIHHKEALFHARLQHKRIRQVRSAGLLIAVEFDDFTTNKKVIDRCLQNGLLTDWFLFASNCMRIAPPLMISDEEIVEACEVILESIESVE